MNTLDLKQAAAFIKMHPEEVRRRARLGLVLGAKPGKSWVFIEEDLAAWAIRGTAADAAGAQKGTGNMAIYKRGYIWCIDFARPRESALNALLRQAIRPKRGDSTPG